VFVICFVQSLILILSYSQLLWNMIKAPSVFSRRDCTSDARMLLFGAGNGEYLQSSEVSMGEPRGALKKKSSRKLIHLQI
jgi:hypothetical protein